MADMQRREGMDISAFFGFLRRRGPIIALAVAVGALAGYVISNGQDERYSAGASVLLEGPPSNQAQDEFSPGVPEASVDREALFTADAVSARAQSELAPRVGEQRAAKLVDGAEVTSGQDSTRVDITVLAGDPGLAAATANAIATGGIEDRRESALAKTRRARRVTEREVARVDEDDAAAAATLQAQLQDLRVRAATADGNAALTTRATAPSGPVSPKPSRDAALGGFAGLLLGFVLAMVREQLDRRLMDSKDLEEVFGLPVLAMVPKNRAFARRGKPLEGLPPAAAESFQMLRANLRFLHTDRDLRSVVVTSPGVGDGKSTISLNLAKADASVGRRVLLVEADMRRPLLGEALGLGEETGLATYLEDPGLDLVDVARRVPVASPGNGSTTPRTLDVIVAGHVPSNPSELVNSDRMRDLVQEAERDYDLVVIDTSPAGIVADAIPLMSQATAVVIVGRVGRVTGAEADNLREQLERIDAPAFGLVANFSGSGEGGYGYD